MCYHKSLAWVYHCTLNIQDYVTLSLHQSPPAPPPATPLVSPSVTPSISHPTRPISVDSGHTRYGTPHPDSHLLPLLPRMAEILTPYIYGSRTHFQIISIQQFSRSTTVRPRTPPPCPSQPTISPMCNALSAYRLQWPKSEHHPLSSRTLQYPQCAIL